MLIYGTHACKFCGHENNWFYQIPQKLGSKPLLVDKLPDDKIKVHKTKRLQNRTYEMKYCCEKCSINNYFIYESDYVL